MKIILFRFEKDIINFLECDLSSGNLILGDKEKISLNDNDNDNKGEKYSNILERLLQIQTKYSADCFIYQSPQKYRWTIKDEEWYVNSAILNLFCYKEDLKLIELTTSVVRWKLWIPNKDFKNLLIEEKERINDKYSIAKSHKIMDWLVLLSLMKDTL